MTETVPTVHTRGRRYHVSHGTRSHVGDFDGSCYSNGEPYKTVCGQWVDATFLDPFWTPVLCKKCAAWKASA